MVINSALFIDFDNIFIALQKESPTLATRFATRPLVWLRAIESQLGKSEINENGIDLRRLIARRTYASPHTISSYRRVFTMAGVEVVDCPPLTQKMKNSADIYIVMDVLDYLDRYPHIEEFIILSADADFVPVLNRLRKELKRSIIFTAYDTASSYRNCSDMTLDAERIRKWLDDDTEASRRSATPKSGSSTTRTTNSATNVTADGWNKIEACLMQAAAKGLGRLPVPSAAHTLRERLHNVVGSNWAGYGKFSDLMAAAPTFASLRLENSEYRIPDFKIDLSNWGAAGQGDMENFVQDVLRLQTKRIPVFNPQEYCKIFDALADAFRAHHESFIDAINDTAERCKKQSIDISPQEVRFMATGIRMQRYELGENSIAVEIAQIWRENVWEICEEPEWMREEEEAILLATWFHSSTETPEEGARDFIARTALGPLREEESSAGS